MSTIADYAAKKSAGKLSHVPSELIEQTVADVRWMIKQENVVLDLAHFCHANGRCHACCAGALILRRIAPVNNSRVRKARSFDTHLVSDRVWRLLDAVDSLRRGWLDCFLRSCSDVGHSITEEEIDELSDCDCPSIEGTPTAAEAKQWCRNVLVVAKRLRKAGH